MDNFSLLQVPINDLREGMVLNQDLTADIGLRQGRVLTASDIGKIRELKPNEKLSVVLSNSLRSQLNIPDPVRPANAASDNKRGGSLKSSQIANFRDALGENEIRASLNDQNLDGALKGIVEKKKAVIRGDDYQNRVENYRNEHLEKYKNSIKSIQTSTRKDTLNIIDHYAQTHADMESLNDVDALETGELVNRSDTYEQNAQFFMDSILTKKTVFTSFVENIVVDFLADMGYDLARGMLAFLSRNESKVSYIASHSLQVMIVALVAAIELTRIINMKSQTLDSEDLGTLLSISKKSFTLEELVNLGIAALLHDIEFRKQVPDLKENSIFNIQQQSIIDLHPSNGYHLAKTLNIDFEVQRAVFQHHERYDGSGYPSGLHPRFFTKYTPVLMFAEYYTEMITRNPFVNTILTPRDTVVKLLSSERAKFDGDVIYAFLKAASLYPVGSWVVLSDSRIGLVRGVNSEKLDRPTIGVYFDRNFSRMDIEDVNLMKSPLQIVKPLSWDIVRSAVKEPLDFIYR
ncbi:MAG: HD domain-containing protein [Brevinematales bacterium]|nr:HD domain-containing protein [Brevinematales bacterium]